MAIDQAPPNDQLIPLPRALKRDSTTKRWRVVFVTLVWQVMNYWSSYLWVLNGWIQGRQLQQRSKRTWMTATKPDSMYRLPKLANSLNLCAKSWHNRARILFGGNQQSKGISKPRLCLFGEIVLWNWMIIFIEKSFFNFGRGLFIWIIILI
jgi:hypothetical protein